MPRASNGSPRPVTVLSTTARTIYRSLVSHIDDALPESTRGPGLYDKHRNFGLDGSFDYFVEVDIAACYEYIDHSILREELVSRSSDVIAATSIVDLLAELYQLGRGIPQMLEPSDRLADAYLSRLDRRIQRDGWTMNRYADDFRILTQDWVAANECLAQVSEHARTMGLILSSTKSTVLKRTTLERAQIEDDAFFRERFNEAREALAEAIFQNLQSPYGDLIAEMETNPENPDVWPETGRQIVLQWHNETGGADGVDEAGVPLRNALGLSLLLAERSDERLADKVLGDLVFKYPIRLEQVCRYILHRQFTLYEEDEDWASVLSLSQAGRLSPWGKLWLLHTAEQLQPTDSESQARFLEWVERQLLDRHELVRGQAAWLCGLNERLSQSQLQELYSVASPLTQPALAAATARVATAGAQFKESLRNDTTLNREAFQWAEAL